VELYLYSFYAFMAWAGTTFTFTNNINDGCVGLYIGNLYDICHTESMLFKSYLVVHVLHVISCM